MSANDFKDAIIAHANTAQLGPGARIENRHVESRMLLWCRSGRGTVIGNGRKSVFEPGHYLVLPWAHDIVYRADNDDPFQVAGIHIIPRHDRNIDITFDVAHNNTPPLTGVEWRGDVDISSLRTVRQGTFDQSDPLPHLAEYILALFLRGNPPEWLARQLAAPLLEELSAAAQQRRAYAPDAPPELGRMITYVRTNHEKPISLSDLSELSGLSASTVGRMFRRHLHTTPVTWIQQQKIQRACMLLRTRRLNVTEVATQVGMPDPYYFSKCFKKHTGMSPREYRTKRKWV